MMAWSAPAELVPVFERVAAVVLFSTVMSCAVLVIRRFFRRQDDGKQRAASSLLPRAAVWVVIAVLLLGADAAGTIGLALVVGAIAVVAIGEVWRVAQGIRLPASAFWMRIAAVIYVAVPLILLVLLRARPDGFTVAAWIVLVVCFNDVMAMFGGLLAGRTPLFRTISPGKTLEGYLLGLAGALGGAALMRFAFPLAAAPVYFGASFVIALAGCAGDLAASALKRAAGVKDFGTSLPGHGGVMDRLDSLLFAIPVGYVAVALFW